MTCSVNTKEKKMRKGKKKKKVKKSICSDCITGNGPGIVYDGIRGSGIVSGADGKS